ncbi:RDD family protein [Sulfurovum mangrovi]|uniref:RDD family protein n=1 Tax=Sulfurovum mangrovi TaxID=2893889 RepID=UPI001E47CDFD|nr:RDD family protein [Sulfurovum mangrovi]UFH59466.1 RDD family protein [Sulfurovum mangrovi]UFH60617.1 RDD family protein [Sulfurovum mangrovi]
MEASETRPSSLNKEAWLRYFARVIDITIGTLIVGSLVGVIIGIFFVILGVDMHILSVIPEYISMIFVMMIYFFIEANIISSFGTTPGKKLLGITVFRNNGEYLDYKRSLKRTFTLWFKGLALSLPIISLITLIMAYNRYTDHGITSWDEAYDVKVSCQPIGTLRLGAGIAVWIVAIIINLSVYIGN